MDGGYHEERVRLDAVRERRLERSGYTVVRLTAQEVINAPQEAVAVIVSALQRLQ